MLTKETRIKIPDDIDNLCFCGDIHGNLDYLKYFIKTGVGFKNKISNSCIILCGDVGLGLLGRWKNCLFRWFFTIPKYTDNL